LHDIGTGTFGGKIGTLPEVEDLKQENIALRQDMLILKD